MKVVWPPLSFVCSIVAHSHLLPPTKITSYKAAKRTKVVSSNDSLPPMEADTTRKSEQFGHLNSAYKNEDGRSKIYMIHVLHSASEQLRSTDPKSTVYRCRFGGLFWLDECNAFVTKSRNTLLRSCRKKWLQRDEVRLKIPSLEWHDWQSPSN